MLGIFQKGGEADENVEGKLNSCFLWRDEKALVYQAVWSGLAMSMAMKLLKTLFQIFIKKYI